MESQRSTLSARLRNPSRPSSLRLELAVQTELESAVAVSLLMVIVALTVLLIVRLVGAPKVI